MDALDRIEMLEAIQQGLADIEAGRTRPVKEFLAALQKEFGFPETRRTSDDDQTT